MCTGPHTFQHLCGLDSGEDVGEIKLQCLFLNVKISDFDLADDAVIFAETLDILLGALEVLNEESEPLGFESPGRSLCVGGDALVWTIVQWGSAECSSHS